MMTQVTMEIKDSLSANAKLDKEQASADLTKACLRGHFQMLTLEGILDHLGTLHCEGEELMATINGHLAEKDIGNLYDI